MNRDELENLIKTNLIDLVLQQQETIQLLRARIARLEGLHGRASYEKSHSRVSHHRFRRSFSQFRNKYFRVVLFVILGIILTLLIVLYMNGYFWFL
jgi:hypothetical protein